MQLTLCFQRKVKESDDGDEEYIVDSKLDFAIHSSSKIESHNLLGIVQAIIQSIDSSGRICNQRRLI